MQSASAKCVLGVDDDKDLCETVCEALELEGFTAHCATSLERVHELLRQTDFDLALIDVSLGKDSGIDVAKAVAQCCVKRIVMMSGFPTDLIERELKGVAHFFLRKPFGFSEVLEALT